MRPFPRAVLPVAGLLLLLSGGCEWISRPSTDPAAQEPVVAVSDTTVVDEAVAVADTAATKAEPTPAETGLMVDLPPEERARLTDETERDLAHSQEVVRAWCQESDLPEEMAARLRTIQDYMTMAREALDEGDVQGASNLALKARLLAQEMGAP